MVQRRLDDYVIEVAKQSDVNTEQTSGLLTGTLVSIDLTSAKKPVSEDPRYRTDGGARAPIIGVAHTEIGVPLSVLAEGLVTVAGDGDTAASTHLTHLLASTMQADPDLTTGDTATGSPTVTSVTETNAGRHAVTSIDSKTGVGGAVFRRAADGSKEPRFYTYATDTMTLRMALPNALASGDQIDGAAVVQYHKGDWAAIPYPITINALASGTGADPLNHTLIGAVSKLTIPEAGPADPAQLDFEFQAANVEHDFSGSPSEPTPPVGRVLAGGHLLLALSGQTAATDLCSARIMATIRPDGYTASEKHGESSGVCDWLSNQSAGVVELTVPADFTPGDLTGGSETSWFDALYNQSDNEAHIQLSLGQGVVGAMLNFYWPELVLVDVQKASLNDRYHLKLIWRPKTGSSYPAVVAFQG